MGNAICDAVSFEGFTCERKLGHTTQHEGDGVGWAEGSPHTAACLAVTDEPGPLPSRCNRARGHDGAHESTEHARVIHTWESKP